MKSYVVSGHVGEYADQHQWCVRVFTNEEQADTFAREAQAHLEALGSEIRRRAWAGPFDREALTEAELDTLSKYDPTLVILLEHGVCAGRRTAGPNFRGGDRTTYEVEACELDTSIVLTLIQFVGKHAWRESRALTPNPREHVAVYPLLEEMERLFDLTPEQIDTALLQGQEPEQK
jgi:hypothetical protein